MPHPLGPAHRIDPIAVVPISPNGMLYLAKGLKLETLFAENISLYEYGVPRMQRMGILWKPHQTNDLSKALAPWRGFFHSCDPISGLSSVRAILLDILQRCNTASAHVDRWGPERQMCSDLLFGEHLSARWLIRPIRDVIT